MPLLADFPAHSHVVRVQAGLNKREFKTKAGNDMVLYEQMAYVDCGDPFKNTTFKITHRDPLDELSADQAYELEAISFGVNDYGGLVLTMDTTFKPLAPYKISTIPSKAAA